jgi:hypothetical protein
MALTDVSRQVTVFQRLCKFAEEFTAEHLDLMVEALSNLFRTDLAEGEEGPDVPALINGLLRRLRATLSNMVLAETELLGSFKANNEFRASLDQLTSDLRQAFDQARTECRNHFGRPKSDSAGFPARIRDDPGALLRQARLVSWTFRGPDFVLGTPLIAGSTTTAEFILGMFEPKVEALETALSDAVRRKARTRGKQVAKNKEMADFRTTYSLFVSLVKSSFRLAGQSDLAERLTLAQPRRSAKGTTPETTPPEGTTPEGSPSDDSPSDDSESEDSPSDDSGGPTPSGP